MYFVEHILEDSLFDVDANILLNSYPFYDWSFDQISDSLQLSPELIMRIIQPQDLNPEWLKNTNRFLAYELIGFVWL